MLLKQIIILLKKIKNIKNKSLFQNNRLILFQKITIIMEISKKIRFLVHRISINNKDNKI
jgi:hypothetical protein